MQDADAADLTQDVLRNVSGAFRRGGFDAKLGSFARGSSPSCGIGLRDLQTSPKRHERGAGDTATLDRLGEIPDAIAGAGRTVGPGMRTADVRLGGRQVRARFAPASWQAFWRTAVEGERGPDVAKALGLTVAAVYLAKGRVMAAIKEQIKLVEQE